MLVSHAIELYAQVPIIGGNVYFKEYYKGKQSGLNNVIQNLHDLGRASAKSSSLFSSLTRS